MSLHASQSLREGCVKQQESVIHLLEPKVLTDSAQIQIRVRADDFQRVAASTETAAYPVRITTLGDFEVSIRGRAGYHMAAWNTNSARALLKCLVAAPSYRCTRDDLIEWLWPGQRVTQARAALRQALSRARRTLQSSDSKDEIVDEGLPSPYLGTRDQFVWLNVGHDAVGSTNLRIWVDRSEFERRALVALRLLEKASSSQDIHEGERQAEEARELYNGPFLPADRYADWSSSTRQSCQRLWVLLTRGVARVALQEHRFARAELWLGQLLDTCPDDENAAFHLMQVQAAAGQRGEALRTFERLRRHLASALDMQPARQLQDLANAIRSSNVTSEPFLRVPSESVVGW